MADIHVPKLNNNDTEYQIVEWLVGNGKPVIAGEPIAVLETSKAADELEAGETGYLHHAAALGTWIAPGALLARVTAEAAPPSAPAADVLEAEQVASEVAAGQEVERVTVRFRLTAPSIASSASERPRAPVSARSRP